MGAEWSSSSWPLGPCHEGGFVAAQLRCLTGLGQPREPACATRWLLRALGDLGHLTAGSAQQGSDCDSYMIGHGLSQGSLLLDGLVPFGDVPCTPMSWLHSPSRSQTQDTRGRGVQGG